MMPPAHPMKPFALPKAWTPDQAMAVIELLDELRCHIWSRYELALMDRYRELYGGPEDADTHRAATQPFRDDPIDF